MRVAEHLHLDVPARLDVRLAEHRRVAERGRRLGGGLLDGAGAPRPACGRRACRDRRRPRTPSPAGAGRPRPPAAGSSSGSTGTPAAAISFLAATLEAICSIDSGVGPDPGQPRVDHLPGERRRSRRGTRSPGARRPRRRSAPPRRAGPRAGRSRPACCPGSRTATSASRTNGSPASASECTATVPMPRSRQVRNTRRAISPRLATSSRLIVVMSRPHILKTPKRSVPWIGAFSITDRQMPRTVRVSRGSITPSSYTIPDRKNGRLCSSTDCST